MRIAVVSDIHGNRAALEAVLADLRETSPDLVLHGGDLADAGSSPVEIVDHIRNLGWPGVMGNTDEMLVLPESLTEFAKQSPELLSLWIAIEEMAVVTRQKLGDDRLAWLRGLPRLQSQDQVALVHASPETAWRAPGPNAGDTELQALYSPLGFPVAVYGHIHRPFIRRLPCITIVNSGSVGLPYDGDRRAAYLLLDDSTPSIRRVEYDIDREIESLAGISLPHADWIARALRAASPQMP
jgi:putative phosphoesterase